MDNKNITPQGMPTKLNSYDVLLLPSSAPRRHDDHQPLQFAQGNHAGNQRFRVFSSLLRQKYLQAEMLGDELECEAIAVRLVDTVCNKCVPNGRFFERGRDDKRWYQFRRDGSSVIKMARKALKRDPEDNNNNSSVAAAATSEERSPKRACRRPGSLELLCKAASKELPATQQRTRIEIIESPPNPFDVICRPDGRGMVRDRKHTGNNRLKIMLDLRKNKYETSNEEGRRRIVEEVVSSIVNDASSHFLRRANKKSSGKYEVLSREVATICVKTALDDATATTATTEAAADNMGADNKLQFRKSEVQKLVQRKHKKAILDKLENNRKAGGSNCLSSDAPMPTTFHSLLTRNVLVPKAA